MAANPKDMEFKGLEKAKECWSPENFRFENSLPALGMAVGSFLPSRVMSICYNLFISGLDNPPNYKYLRGLSLEAAKLEEAQSAAVPPDAD